MESSQIAAAVLAADGQERSGLGKPIRKTGRQNSGNKGAVNKVDVQSTVITTGRNITDVTRIGSVALCLCLGSFQEVTVRLTIKTTLSRSCSSLSRQNPTSISCRPSPAEPHQVALFVPKTVVLRQTTDNSNRELKLFCQTYI